MKKGKLTFLKPEKGNNLGQWLVEQGISAGFPSPADDFKEIRISLDKELVKNKEATFYARVCGVSMIGAGLDDGDLLIIDRSLNPENGKIADSYNEEKLKEYMKWDSVMIEVNLKLGNDAFECYTCDFTHDYIDINADYRN